MLECRNVCSFMVSCSLNYQGGGFTLEQTLLEATRPLYSAVARPRKFWRYPNRRYNQLKLVSFWPWRCQVSEKFCSCSFCVQHIKLTPCLLKTAKMQFSVFLLFLELYTLDFSQTSLHGFIWHETFRDANQGISRLLEHFMAKNIENFSRFYGNLG